VPGNPYSTAPVPGGGGGAGPSGSDAARLEVRIGELEQVLATVTGRLEELSFQNQSLQNRLDKLIGDVDFRLRALEQGQRGGDAGMAQAAPMGAPPPPMAQQQAMPPQAGFGQVPPQAAPGAVQTPAGRTSMTVPSPGGSPMPPLPQTTPGAGAPPPSGQPGVLGTMSTAELAAAQRQQAAAPPAAPAPAPAAASNVALPGGSARDQYEYAYALLRQRDYPGAETAFRQFIDRNKTDELTGNALYWLGETHYVRRQFEPAAIAFLDGYKNFPKGSKAPDNLLKLGMSLAGMNRQKEACATLTKLNAEFPDAPQNLKSVADNERRKLACT
jgi:tol-pal system protein YbgF